MNYFPIYLDAAAMHPVLPCARDAFLCAPFGNPSSEHQVGHEARNALEQAREKIAALMDCDPQEIYFTATATEAAALALHSLHIGKLEGYIGDAYTHKIPDKPNVYNGFLVQTSPYEHHAILENAEIGLALLTRNAYAKMLANNETGEVFQTPDMDGDVWLCDATAAVGHMPVSFRTLGCDYLIADAIKFGGVPGAAFLIAKNGAPIHPMIRGGGQERGIRSGTENVPAICAMAAALEWQTEHMKENAMKLATLFAYFQTTLSKIDGIQWNTPFDLPHLPHILNVSFGGVDAHALALLLSKDGVMVSPGAACSNGLNEPSHVIMAMFHDEARARSAIRISLSHENTEEEIRIAAGKIKDAVAYLRSLT